MRFRTLLTALLALALLIPAGASAYTPRHGKPCRHGFAARHKVVKLKGHRHRVRICVKRKAKPKTSAPTLATKTKLHAHLDPSYTRDLMDPFKITYAYSASATQQQVPVAGASAVAAEEPAPLPSGVLALYSDGKLECAINVGGSATGSQCPVAYQALGDHSVTTIYTSGENSATETEVERIEPLATTTTLSVGYEPLSQGYQTMKGWRIGTLSVTGSLTPAMAGSLRLWCQSEADCLAMPSQGYPVLNPTVEVPVYGKCEPASTPIQHGPTVVPCQQVKVDPLPEGSTSAEVKWWPASDFEAGTNVLRAAPWPGTKGGYLDSEARVAVRLTPELHGTFCDPEHTGPWC